MPTPIIPIDPIDRAIGQIVWRLPLELTAEMDNLFNLDALSRVRRLTEIIMVAAKKDPKIVEVLRQPHVLPSLKQMAEERQVEHSPEEGEFAP